jgi:hypothetical protein
MITTGLLLLAAGSWAEPETRNQVPVTSSQSSGSKVQRLDKNRKRLGVMLKVSCATLEPLNPEP